MRAGSTNLEVHVVRHDERSSPIGRLDHDVDVRVDAVPLLLQLGQQLIDTSMHGLFTAIR